MQTPFRQYLLLKSNLTMRIFNLFACSAIILPGALFSQALLPDTLLLEPVIGDPITLMIQVPSGADEEWVNYDQDMLKGNCVDGTATPFGWYIESDFGLQDPNLINDAFTSCSYLSNPNAPNDNWLILPPISIPDEGYYLCWRSLPLEGPAFTDGYRVVASTGSNIPDDGGYSTVLFTAAETIGPKIAGHYTLDANDYFFTPGYIHANGYTDTTYFFKDPPNGPLRGRMEPHCVSLAQFSGMTVYFAFHHNSLNDSQLQIDDILVSNAPAVGVSQISANNIHFEILPNPVGTNAYVNWNMEKPDAGFIGIYDMTGKMVFQQWISAAEKGSQFLELSMVKSGIYHCVIQTSSAISTQKLVKL
jgi:hypothetical protein